MDSSLVMSIATLVHPKLVVLEMLDKKVQCLVAFYREKNNLVMELRVLKRNVIIVLNY